MSEAVSVTPEAIQSGMAICQKTAQELLACAKKLQRDYQRAGSEGWNDQKYDQLGTYVEECLAALRSPVKELEECHGALAGLLATVDAYESARL